MKLVDWPSGTPPLGLLGPLIQERHRHQDEAMGRAGLSGADRSACRLGSSPLEAFTYLGSIDTGGDVVGSQVSLYTTFWSDTARVLNV